jgi:hypothetical protein
MNDRLDLLKAVPPAALLVALAALTFTATTQARQWSATFQRVTGWMIALVSLRHPEVSEPHVG